VGVWLAGGFLLRLIFLFFIFKVSFLKILCRMFLSTWQTLYRVPDKWHTAKIFFADAICRVPFAVCNTQQRLWRV